jgi:intracellular sulfur oxidation DsrE/DsrF family protein
MRNYVCALFVLALGCGCLGWAYGEQSDQVKPAVIKEAEKTGGTRMSTQRKVVFHLDADEEGRFALALENIKNLFKEVPAQSCQVSIVTNGKAVNLLRKDRVGKHAAAMQELHKLGVRFNACRNALANNKIATEDLFEIVQIVPAGILELIDLQAQGFAYIKP